MSLPQDPTATLQSLQSSIAHLSDVLDPVLCQKLSVLSQQLESGSSQSDVQVASDHASNGQAESSRSKSNDAANRKESGGRLDSARLNISAAYVLLDLVWMYLRVNSKDPKTHNVTASLERVKNYFQKVAVAQRKLPRLAPPASSGGDGTNAGAGLEKLKAAGFGKEERRMPVDGVAAGRFVKAALDRGAGKSTSSKSSKFDSKGSHTRFEDQDDDDDAPNSSRASPSTSSLPKQKNEKHQKSKALDANLSKKDKVASSTQQEVSDKKRKSSESAAKVNSTDSDPLSQEAKALRKKLKEAKLAKKATLR
ncbi:hypothetical protein IE81DRAFT_319890 [Ceraceosorus guamensis]|uniref:Exosome complex protein n=1 Tax=Ceraceosorus guamensis TaxID=1522189 RepID=A0A316WDS2_9BASI|nr:hypothetical protein IE81DRAFT_319890 [Ceraceosorus guamensis]PWN45605.1 hypothetical protein IE81DRAFT_319890 [Ceraceosorus guamensis]